MVKGFNFEKVIFSCEQQPTQLGTEINRPHINFDTSTFPLKGTVPSVALPDQSLNLHGNMLVFDKVYFDLTPFKTFFFQR